MLLVMNLLDLFNIKTVLLTGLIFVPIERLLALRSEQNIFRRGWQNDLIYWFLNGALINLGLLSLLTAEFFAAKWLVPASVLAAVANQPYWLQIAEIIFLADLGFYGTHRMFHAVPWLWKFHLIHHSIEELDWLAAARIHPIDQIFTKGVSVLPIVMFGFSEVAIGVFAVLYQWHTILLHANVRISFGPLRWLFASPEFHHWHHSSDKEARDKNFASQILFFDALFGTLHMPRDKMPTKYGVDEAIPQPYVAQLLYPFWRLRHKPATPISAAWASRRNVAPQLE
jgi:sterol desaturase/sphingolipid hydroxylase (fatty acid hydroxylase superfamily)